VRGVVVKVDPLLNPSKGAAVVAGWAGHPGEAHQCLLLLLPGWEYRDSHGECGEIHREEATVVGGVDGVEVGAV
jgi:hypothetical protein